MKSSRAIGTPLVFGAAVVLGVLLGGSLFFALPRSSGSTATNSTSTQATTTSSSQSSTSSSSGQIVLSMAPSTRILGPGFSQDFTLTVTLLGSLAGTYNLIPFALPPGLSVNLNPVSFTASAGTQSVDAFITASNQLAPGTYQVGISAAGGGRTINQTFAIQIVPHLVQISSSLFKPDNVTISAGSTIVWVSLDGLIADAQVTHEVQLPNGMGQSPTLHQYDSWSFTFTQPGTYRYSDPLTSETGVIIVK